MIQVTQATVTEQTRPTAGRGLQRLALFNPDGTAFTGRDLAFGAVTTASAIGTVGKTTTADEPAANTVVPVIFTNGNSANSPTLAFNGGSARAIKLGGTASTGAKLAVAAGGVALFWFDGTVLHQLGTHT